MNECNIKFGFTKKVKNSIPKIILKILSTILAIIIFICVFLGLLIGELFIEGIIMGTLLAIFGLKKSTKIEEYNCKALLEILENDTVVFCVKDFNDIDGRIYDLKISFPIEKIKYTHYFKDELSEDRIIGRFSGYPIIEKKSNTINEIIDCSDNKEEIDVQYGIQKNDELINKIQMIWNIVG